MTYYAGVDFGGTSVKLGIVDLNGNILIKDIIYLDIHSNFENTICLVISKLKEFKKNLGKNKKLSAIGIGIPGFIDKTSGIPVAGCKNIPFLLGKSVAQFLKNEFSIPAFTDNDATCAAAGEHKFGAGRKYSNFVLITLGTGIGGGLVLDGKIYRGTGGFAGEIGHICVDPNGIWCNCGSRGCFEQYASGSAIVKRYKERLKKRGLANSKRVSPISIFKLAKNGNTLALDTIDEAARKIAQVFGAMINTLNPEACIIGGGISKEGEFLLTPVRKHIPDFAWPILLKDVDILTAELRNDAGLLGASALAIEMSFSTKSTKSTK